LTAPAAPTAAFAVWPPDRRLCSLTAPTASTAPVVVWPP